MSKREPSPAEEVIDDIECIVCALSMMGQNGSRPPHDGFGKLGVRTVEFLAGLADDKIADLRDLLSISP